MGVYDYPDSTAASQGQMKPQYSMFEMPELKEPSIHPKYFKEKERMTEELRKYRLALAGILSGATIIVTLILSIAVYQCIDRVTPGVSVESTVQHQVIRPPVQK